MEHAQSRLDLSLPINTSANLRANTLAAEWYGQPPRQTRATPLRAAHQERQDDRYADQHEERRAYARGHPGPAQGHPLDHAADYAPCPADHYSRSGAYLGHPERKHSAYGLVMAPARRPEEQAVPSREEKTIRGVLPD